MRNHRFSTFFVTLYLLIYAILFNTGASFELLATMFVISPFLVLWMAYTILKYGQYEGEELKEVEEWGYQDKKRELLS